MSAIQDSLRINQQGNVRDQVEHDGLGHHVNQRSLRDLEVRRDEQLCAVRSVHSKQIFEAWV